MVGLTSGPLLLAMTDHSFKHTYFKKPVWCSHCGQFLWGVASKQGYKCKGASGVHPALALVPFSKPSVQIHRAWQMPCQCGCVWRGAAPHKRRTSPLLHVWAWSDHSVSRRCYALILASGTHSPLASNTSSSTASPSKTGERTSSLTTMERSSKSLQRSLGRPLPSSKAASPA